MFPCTVSELVFFPHSGLFDCEVMLNLTSLISNKIEFIYKAVGRPLAKLQLTKIIFHSQLHWLSIFNFYLLQFFFVAFLSSIFKMGRWLDMLLTIYLLHKNNFLKEKALVYL